VCPLYVHQDTLPLVGNELGTFSCQSVALLLEGLLTVTRQMMMVMINSSKDIKNLQPQPTPFMNMFNRRPLNSVLGLTGDLLGRCD
jgi:hypothetical protein